MELEQVLCFDQPVYAHRAEGKEKETLLQHTRLCEIYFETLMEKKELNRTFSVFFMEYMDGVQEKNFGEIDGFCMELLKGVISLHDTGKINPAFQKEKMKYNLQGIKEMPFLKGARHSFFSAVIYLDYGYHMLKQQGFNRGQQKKIKALLLANSYVIARHHGDLEHMKTFIGEFCEGGQGYEAVSYLREHAFPLYKGLFYFTPENVETVLNVWGNMIRGLEQRQLIQINGYIRLLYSLLVSSDYYGTTEYMSGIKMNAFGELVQKQQLLDIYENSPLVRGIREYQSGAKAEGMNRLRNDLFLDAEQCWKESCQENIFFLEAPTGGGKSNIAMNLSLQMVSRGLNKIYYVYPFNTLVEQNLESFRNILGEQEEVFSKITVVNSITPIAKEGKKKEKQEEYEVEYYQKALLDRQFLNYPIIITTHVSLFETIFGNRKESLFGFLQLANSVVVLDEIQSYKNKIWSEIMLFLTTYAKLLNIKIIVMSATLPDFEYLTGEKNQVVKLLKNRNTYFTHPMFRERVKLSYELLDEKLELEVLYQHLYSHIKPGQNVLIEFIKKKSAYEFYDLLCKKEAGKSPIRLITGDDNILDREKILKEVKANSKHGMILVATQVVEAGVDIDMDVGYKDISKLDSEEQFLGRINRSCKRYGIVYFFDFDAADTVYKGDVRINPEFTLERDAMREILRKKDFSAYYRPVLDVLIRNWNLSTGEEGLGQFFSEIVGQGDFKGISDRMKLIEEDSWNMSVFLARTVSLPDGNVVDGWTCWNEYKTLLQNQTIDYAKKQVKLYEIRSKLNYFIYEIKKNPDLIYSDRIGELYGIEDGETYFVNGKLNRKKLEEAGGQFI